MYLTKTQHIKALKDVKSSDPIFFLLGLSPIVNKFDTKSKSLSLSRGNYRLIYLENLKET